MSFLIHALPMQPFKYLFALTDEELRKVYATRLRVKEHPGFPCRVSLVDASVGETVILTNFQHQSENTPYRASHAIFIRENAKQVHLVAGEIPPGLLLRLISIRAYNEDHYMIDASVAEGKQLKDAIEAMLTNRQVSYLHLHNAKPGCFQARVTRAGSFNPM